MRDGYEAGGPLDGFSEPVAFMKENLDAAGDDSGVHVVWDPDGTLIYVGMTKNQRQRLLMHLSGDRLASVLHKAVGKRLDREYGREATRDEIRSWLNRCEVAWNTTEERQELKARIMVELEPALNEVTPVVESTSTAGDNPWDVLIGWARVFYEDPGFDAEERNYKLDLAAEIRSAREVFEAGGDWWEPLSAAFRSSNNNLTRFDQRDGFLDWARANPEDAAAGLSSIWDVGSELAGRIDGFMAVFPQEALKGSGLRTTIASVLLLGDDPHSLPVYKPVTFNDAYRLVGMGSDWSGSTEAERYQHAVAFVDRFIDEASSRDLAVRDRLDGQSLIWAVLRNKLPETATDEQRRALALYRAEYRPTWWVNQGATYNAELDGRFVWAPQQTKAGYPVKHHTDVLQMRRNDVIVHYAKGAIRAIGLVTKYGHTAPRPGALPTDVWLQDGFRANVRYFELDQPILLNEIPVGLREDERSAFTSQGGVKQGYAYGLSSEFSEELRELFPERWPVGSPWYHEPPQHWLLQSNPDQSDLIGDMENMGIGGEGDWVVRAHKDKMRVGDRVVMWQSGPAGGAYGLATLVGEPYERTLEESFFGREGEWGVALVLDEVLDPPILRSQLEGHPILKEMTVMRGPQGTSFQVAVEEWDALMELIDTAEGHRTMLVSNEAFDGLAAGGWNWEQWDPAYNMIGVGDHLVVGYEDGDLVRYMTARLTSDGIYETEVGGVAAYLADVSVASEQYATGSAEFDGAVGDGALAALQESAADGGRGVILGEATDAPPASLSEIVAGFAESLDDAGLWFSTAFVRSFLVSLATKRFVLLTGLSGSGKTRLARAFGQWLGDGQYLIEAVRPDWTGPDALLGYEDGLSEPKANGRAWVVPSSLEFMLKAHNDRSRPYLLILDEMNLAHVERYFADVLSGMESGEPILPNLQRDDAGEWRLAEGSDTRVPFPSNLFVAGTVNIDETTYMFSPKVLDRANTLEFRVLTDSLVVDATPPEDLGAAGRRMWQGFLTSSLAAADGWDGSDAMAGHMQDLHRILAADDREFGHRVFFEAQRFGALLGQAGADDVLSALDLQVMQKVLPRFHGSLRQLSGPLARLGEWTYSLTVSDDGFDPLDQESGDAKLPISFDKIQRMTKRLRANHFVSFAE